MDSLLLDHQQDIYAAIFYGALILFAVVEFLLPRLRGGHGIGARWTTNFGLIAVNFLVGRLILPVGTIAFALYVESKGWGVLRLKALPQWLALPAGVLLLDFSAYAVHRVSHAVPLLWRTHVVHHADLDMDFTTGFRHHPFESLISSGTQLGTIALLGVSPLTVLVYEILGAMSSVYTHANFRLHPGLDRLLRLVFITPDVHLVHHSAARAETDSNFGQTFIFWDRLFGTYVHAPAAGVEGMTTGLDYFREPRDLVIDRVLTMPFRVPRPSPLPVEEKGTQTAPPSA